jgi:hypothetical protein
MKKRDDVLLQRRFQIDQQVAAADQVHLRERRIDQQVLLGKDAHIAHVLVDAVAALHLHKKAAQPFRGNVALNIFRINAVARLVDAGLAHVRPPAQ